MMRAFALALSGCCAGPGALGADEEFELLKAGATGAVGSVSCFFDGKSVAFGSGGGEQSACCR